MSKKTDYVVAGAEAGSKLDKARGARRPGARRRRAAAMALLLRRRSRDRHAPAKGDSMQRSPKPSSPSRASARRFLPATKASPKEMLPIVDKPLIQYAVEEAVAAGITDMIFITGRNKRAIEDHFDKAYELEAELAARNKNELLRDGRRRLRRRASTASTSARPRRWAWGTRCCARARGGRRALRRAARRRPDRCARCRCMQQMTDVSRRTKAARVIGVMTVPREESASYGIVETGRGDRTRGAR